ncbi:MAG: RNA methyltransferase [Kiloniellales bacterium]|nr:RNA methyltransferase [Kiloniellales bacterium]
MAGTDKSRAGVQGGPIVILVAPQLGENIGMVARAMLNCGLTALRLVKPRDGWPSEAAVKAASGADQVLAGARLFETTAEAVADCRRVYATTARPRGMVKPVVTPRRAAEEMRVAVAADEPVGLLFGPERSGLTNDDLALADHVVEVPLNPAFSSLNLAQAVLIVGYEWYQAPGQTPPARLDGGGAAPASKQELLDFLERLEGRLDESGFLYPPEKRPGMVRNIRNLFQRAELTEAEVRTLHGIVSALSRPRARGSEE